MGDVMRGSGRWRDLRKRDRIYIDRETGHLNVAAGLAPMLIEHHFFDEPSHRALAGAIEAEEVAAAWVRGDGAPCRR